MQISQNIRVSVKTRNLLLVIFLTLTLTALVFLLAVGTLDRKNKEIFSHVGTTIQNNTTSSELYKMLVALELDIRDLISVILREPYKLTTAKKSLKDQFEQIQLKAERRDAGPLQQKFLKQLLWYRSSLDRLLWDYGDLNSVLYEVYFYINNISEQLSYMEEATGQIMIDLALLGRNTEALQQVYVLVTIAREQMLQTHVLVNSSMANYDPQLLVKDSGNNVEKENHTASGRVAVLDNTLRTLTAADDRIASYASNILQLIPLLQDNIVDLSAKLASLNEHHRLFIVERNNSMKLLAELDKDNQGRISSIKNLVREHGRDTRLIAWIISLLVVVISCIGLMLTRKLSLELEHAVREAFRAREKGESLNRQLKDEIVERKKIAEDLSHARDELEHKVRERTADLSAANRGLALEIEERKNAEYELSSEKEQLSVTLRSIGDGVITTGINSEVILINKVAEQLTGWKQSDALGKPLGEVFHIICKKTREDCENPVEMLLSNGKIYNLDDEKILVAKDGTEKDISDSCAPIRDRKSNIIGAVLVFRDVTEKKKMQDDALKSEKLKSVGVLAGGIAHDFNNILAALLGNISLAKLQLTKETNTRAWELLEAAERASIRARNLTQQLLTFSKGGEPIKKVESISDIVRDSADFILSGGKVHCEYDIEKDLWPVKIDTGQMSQVVQNIIINAIHAMPKGGMLEISCANFVNENNIVASLAAGNYVRVSIKDQGPGIPEELLDKIFDPYFTTKEEGSGLGLALTHSIISKHQGYIEVESDGRGADFVIYLPAFPGHLLERKKTRERGVSPPGKAKILVMDDEDMVRDIARDLLVYLGFEVVTASNGQETLDLYKQMMETDAPFDAVIMDLTIPGGMGGKEAIQKLLEIDPQAKGIVSSGYSNDPVMAEYEKHGFSGMVNKPFEISELMETVNSVIRSGKETSRPE